MGVLADVFRQRPQSNRGAVVLHYVHAFLLQEQGRAVETGRRARPMPRFPIGTNNGDVRASQDRKECTGEARENVLDVVLPQRVRQPPGR